MKRTEKSIRVLSCIIDLITTRNESALDPYVAKMPFALLALETEQIFVSIERNTNCFKTVVERTESVCISVRVCFRAGSRKGDIKVGAIANYLPKISYNSMDGSEDGDSDREDEDIDSGTPSCNDLLRGTARREFVNQTLTEVAIATRQYNLLLRTAARSYIKVHDRHRALRKVT